MMNRGYFKPNFWCKLKNIFFPDHIMKFLVLMRRLQYYSNSGRLYRGVFVFNAVRYKRLSVKLGFSIGYRVFGYGLVIPHYGTIVVGDSNRIGNYCVLHTSTCISDNQKIIGDGLYVATGVKMTSRVTLGNNISIGANSLVNKSVCGDNLLLVGSPASLNPPPAKTWYIRDGEQYTKRVREIEDQRARLNL